MYHHKNRHQARRQRNRWRGDLILATVLVVMVVLGLHFYRQGSAANQMAARQVSVAATPATDQPPFDITLPAGWKLSRHDHLPYPVYGYSSGTASLDIYVDRLPQRLAVGRMVSLHPQAGRYHPGAVSAFCATYPGAGLAADPAQTGIARVRYDGAEFLCDNVANADTLVASPIDGTPLGIHKILVVYTDPSRQPDFMPLLSILASLHP